MRKKVINEISGASLTGNSRAIVAEIHEWPVDSESFLFNSFDLSQVLFLPQRSRVIKKIKTASDFAAHSSIIFNNQIFTAI